MSKEPKDERFIRLAEARVNKIIKMVRLLGNLSGSSNYSYTDSQVEQIYDALQTELDKSRKRFTAAKTGKKRFSLSDSYEPDTTQERYPTIVLDCRTVPTCARKQLTIRISRRLTSTGIKEKHLNRNWLRLWSTIRNVVKVMRYVSAFIVRMRKTQFITGPTWQKGNNYGITISRNNVWQEFL